MTMTNNNVAKTAQAVFDKFTERFGWDSEIQADVLVKWCGEAMIEPLLRYIQDAGQTEDFEEFLIGNFGELDSEVGNAEEPDWRKVGF